MQIFALALVAVIAVSAANAQPEDATGRPWSDRRCIAGQKKMKDCNICQCVADGSGFTCTTTACPRYPVTCEPGTKYMHYCHACICPTNGLRKNAVCTIATCLGVWTVDGRRVREPLVDPTPRPKRQAKCGPPKSTIRPSKYRLREPNVSTTPRDPERPLENWEKLHDL